VQRGLVSGEFIMLVFLLLKCAGNRKLLASSEFLQLDLVGVLAFVVVFNSLLDFNAQLV